MTETGQEGEGLEIVLPLVKNYLDTQIQSIATLRTRGTAYVGFSLALLAIFGGLSQTGLAKLETIAYIVVFSISLILFLLLFYYIFIMFSKEVRRGPTPTWLIKNYAASNRLDALEASITALNKAIDPNEEILRQQSQALDIATILLTLQAILITVTLAFLRGL